MFLINKGYVKIWKIEPKGKYTEIRMSSSEKDKDGNYINSNWSFVRCVGKAHNQIAKMQEGDRAEIKSAKISNETYTDKEGNKKTGFRFVVFEFADSDGSEPTETKQTKAKLDPEDEEKVPF